MESPWPKGRGLLRDSLAMGGDTVNLQLLTRDMWREYARYVVPSILTYVLLCLFNIVDGLFVVLLGWGSAGAGFATALSQMLSFLFALVYFLRAANRLPGASFRLRGGLVRHMVHLGLAPAGLSLLPELQVVATTSMPRSTAANWRLPHTRSSRMWPLCCRCSSRAWATARSR